MELSKEELNIIKQSLAHGSINEIASIAGVKRQSVWSVLNGKVRDSPIIEATIVAIYKRDKERREEKIKEIKSLING